MCATDARLRDRRTLLCDAEGTNEWYERAIGARSLHRRCAVVVKLSFSLRANLELL